MIKGTTATEVGHARVVRELRELIAALDRRQPQVERVGEISIARAASALRADAEKRIEQLERETAAAPRAIDAR